MFHCLVHTVQSVDIAGGSYWTQGHMCHMEPSFFAVFTALLLFVGMLEALMCLSLGA